MTCIWSGCCHCHSVICASVKSTMSLNFKSIFRAIGHPAYRNLFCPLWKWAPYGCKYNNFSIIGAFSKCLLFVKREYVTAHD